MLLTNGFGLAAASLVGQTLGAGAVDEARAWAWLVVRLAMVCVGLLALPAVLVPDAFLGLFLRDPTTLDLARLPLQLTAATMALEVIGMVLMSAHYGAGHSRRVMVISLALQWCFFLPLAFVLSAAFGLGLLAIWNLNIVYRLIQSAVFVWSWETGSWARVRI
jgi:Na+-driven multidrug efflux pump